MKNTITQNELNIFYLDLTYLFHNRLNVYRKFINTLNFYEISILTAFLMYSNVQECSYILLSIYQKFYDFKEREGL